MTISGLHGDNFGSIIQSHLANCNSMGTIPNYPSLIKMQQANQAYQNAIQQSQAIGVQNGNWKTTQTSSGSAANAAHHAGQLSAAQMGAALWANTHPSKPLESAGIRVGEITGWRMWTLRGNYLGSYSRDIVWAPEEAMKGNPKDYDDVGVWAFKDKHRAIRKMMDDAYLGSGRNNVFGSIEMWGNIIEHEEGYRAEFARIKSIDDIHGFSDEDKGKEKLLQSLRKRYKVQCHTG